MSENEIRGADISHPIDHLELDGESFPLAFDMNAMRVAEDVYELQYGRNLNFADIVRHLAAGKIGAVMAVLYGALLSGVKEAGGKPLTWSEYADKFRLTSIPGIQDMLMRNIRAALPKADASEGNEENPQ